MRSSKFKVKAAGENSRSRKRGARLGHDALNSDRLRALSKGES